ncbi:hypothetical protein CR513_39328, partial [Mucuna pruriens]
MNNNIANTKKAQPLLFPLSPSKFTSSFSSSEPEPRMDLNDPNRFRNRKPTLSSRERFLGVPSHAPRLDNPSSSTDDDDDLIEDDVVFSNNDDSTEPSSSSSPIPNYHYHHHHSPHHHHHKGLAFGDAFGILAALPENDRLSPNGSHLCHHKPSVSVSLSSSSSSSSSRLIPTIPKPPPDRSSSVKFHQSAPLNVPVLPTRRRPEFDESDGAAAAAEEILPPHEIVARNSAQSPMLAYSVLEGVGRTLKGRDLRQVRNAIWRQTGNAKTLKPQLISPVEAIYYITRKKPEDMELEVSKDYEVLAGCLANNGTKLDLLCWSRMKFLALWRLS